MVWECADTGPPDKRLSLYTGNCRSCGSSSVKLDRCPDCPITVLDRVRSFSPAGRLLDRVLDLEFDLKHGLGRPDRVTCEERDALRTLEHERGKWEHEEMKAREVERQSEQMMRATQGPRH